MKLTSKQKLIRAIPGVIVGSIMAGIIIWGISFDRRCKRLLKKDDCIQQMVFCKYSHKGLRGSGIEVTTGFVSADDTSLYFTTQAFVKPIPVGLPIVVRYSPENSDCSVFLWDSVIVHNGYSISYFRIEHEGIDYEVTKN
ncbi:hypothetical protein [Sunxiuqinia dokdonensis]|uniref:hypothetical protein n=1 Tax=Sunxiuqinia dokdonensis TaxID=1409788 RepID=UPI00069F0EA9|nr:hypothetical protein [Sunxiuqinia dokdonensis]